MKITLPQAFLNRMQGMLGEDFDAFLLSYDKPRHPALRVNPLKISPQEFQALVPYHLRPVPWARPNGFYYDPEARPGKSPYHEAGLYYIQEPSAMAVAALSGVRPGERVLDLCAAPGGKSTQLAGMMGGKGLLISNEIHPERARILSRNIERLGIRNAIVTNEAPEDLARHFPAFFDRIIVDAPCSGEGMFRKEEEAIPNWSPENVDLCARRQAGILIEADRMLRPGGYLVYSTCTFAPSENEGNIKRFLSERKDYEEVNLPEELGRDMEAYGFAAGSDGKSIRLWPHRLDGEGHFLAILRKKGLDLIDAGWTDPVLGEEKFRKNKKNKNKKNRNGKSFGLFDPEAGRLWKEFSEDALCFEEEGQLRQFGQDLYLLPENVNLDSIKVIRAGLHLGTVKKNRFEPDHALALALNQKELRHCLNLKADSEEVFAYLRGESIPCQGKGWMAVLVDGYPLGWGKASGGILKNHYPKGLRLSLSK